MKSLHLLVLREAGMCSTIQQIQNTAFRHSQFPTSMFDGVRLPFTVLLAREEGHAPSS